MSDINEMVAKEVVKQMMKSIDITSMTEEIVSHLNFKQIAKALTDDLVDAIKTGDAEVYLDIESETLNHVFAQAVQKFFKEKLQ